MVLVLLLLSILFLSYAYTFRRDAKGLQHHISLRQKELGNIIALKREYLERKGMKANISQQERLSLSLLEEVVSKTIKGGKLVALRPTTLRLGKNTVEKGIEVKIEGATLGDVVGFVGTLERAGLSVKKFQMQLKEGKSDLIDFLVVLSEA